jgi:GAF domain-containing protein
MSPLASTHSIRFKLLAVFVLFSCMIVAMVAGFTWVETRTEHINDISNLLTDASLKLNEANSAEKDFVLFETINPRFFESKESRFAEEHAQFINEAKRHLLRMSQFEEAEIVGIRRPISNALGDLDSMKAVFAKLTDLYLTRGFQNTGLVGQMQEQMLFVEVSPIKLDQAKVLAVRKAEKNYLLHKQVKYMSDVRLTVDALKQELRRLPASPQRDALMEHVSSYWLNFLKLVRIEEEIGFKEDRGMKHVLSKISKQVDQDLVEIEERLHERTVQIRGRLFWGVLMMGLLFLLLTIGAGIFVLQRLGTPITALSEAIRQAIDSHFTREMRLQALDKQDEIGQISRDVAYLYGKIQAYTTELLQQKEEIMMQAESLSRVNTDLEEKTEQIAAKNFELEHQNEMIAEQRDQIEASLYNVQLLSKIGQEITNKLELLPIVRLVYGHVRELMPAAVFAVGVFHEAERKLQFYGIEEGKEEVLRGEDSVGEHPATLSDWSFLHGKEIVMQHVDSEFGHYLGRKPALLEQLGSESVIYLPLVVKNRRLGVMTLHARERNAYSTFQLNMLRNLASYTAIALDNAQVYDQLAQQRQLLTVQAQQLQAANGEISDKNKAIMASINYAQRMQQTILPKLDTLRQRLPESFILYKPRDVVSGDFYFFSEVNKNGRRLLVLAAVDCTGHGVPGAFTSMLGNSILDAVVNQQGEADPGVILSKLHQGISYTFKQQESDNKDGMDMAVCVLDLEGKEMRYAGAKNPLVYIQDGTMHYIRGDKHSIGGGGRNEGDKTFTTHTLALDRPTTFYIYSDGYQDQFGGPEGRKLMGQHFRELLFALHQEHADKQRQELDRYFEEWRQESGQKQLDDVLVMGCHIE